MNEILLIMNIDIGLEKPAQLELKKNEDLNEKAKEFCKKYSLHEELVKILVEKIENNLKGNKSSIQSRILKDLEKTNNCFNSNKSKEISNRNSEKKIKPKNDENAGIKLYKRSLYESAKKNKEIEEAQKKVLADSLKECTHRPKLSIFSSILMESTKSNRISIENSLIERARQSSSKKLLLKKEAVDKILEECPFRPNLSESNIKKSDPKLFERLYNDQKERLHRLKKKQIENNETIKEEKTIGSKKIITHFIERQKAFEEGKKMKIEMFQTKSTQEFDENFNHFPKTNSKYNRVGNPKVWQNLYYQSYKQKENLEKLIENDINQFRNNQPKPLFKSNMIILKKRYQKMDEIFNYLDFDEDEVINIKNDCCSNILDYVKKNNQNITKETLKIYENFFSFLKNKYSQYQINKREFSKIFEEFLTSLDNGEIHRFLNPKPIKEISTLTFKPNINRNSALIIQRKNN